MFGIYKNPRCPKSQLPHQIKLFTTADGVRLTARVVKIMTTQKQSG